jgi:hypothetical protein
MGRREMTERTSWDDGYGTVAYLADALALVGEDNDKAVGSLVPQVESLLSRWEVLDTERRARRRAIGKAHALVRRRDLAADTTVTDLHHDTMAQVKQDRAAPLFTRLFPDSLSVVVRMALESELPVLRVLALKLAEDETPTALKKAHEKPLAEAIEKGAAALRNREEAFAAAGRVSARIASWREDVNAALLGIEGALQQIASARKLGPAWVDTFFPIEKSKKGKKQKPPAAGAEAKPA